MDEYQHIQRTICRSEAKLAEAFDSLAGQLRGACRLPVSYVALDWHQLDKELGSEPLVEAFWSTLAALLPQQACRTEPHTAQHMV
jgi:hypothetical protein